LVGVCEEVVVWYSVKLWFSGVRVSCWLCFLGFGVVCVVAMAATDSAAVVDTPAEVVAAVDDVKVDEKPAKETKTRKAKAPKEKKVKDVKVPKEKKEKVVKEPKEKVVKEKAAKPPALHPSYLVVSSPEWSKNRFPLRRAEVPCFVLTCVVCYRLDTGVLADEFHVVYGRR
jgi:hypothetical protein